jgi:hypothetical protein
MTIPATLTVAGHALSRTYSGDTATTRFSGTNGDGITRTVDIIQTLPNKAGRWRHVIRMSYQNPVDPVTGTRPSFTFTLTMDAPSTELPTNVGLLLQQYLTAIDPLYDEVAAGEL